MKSFGTKLVLLVAAAAVAATAESVNASSASSVVTELKEQLRLEREQLEVEREQLQVERELRETKDAELKQLQDEFAMWKASGGRGGDGSVDDNVKVGGGGSGSSFFADVVVERQHYKNKKSSLSAAASSLVVPSLQQQQQQRRLKSDKKNPPQPQPLPDPPNSNTIDPVCYPEKTMETFDFFYNQPAAPMALFPGGNANGDGTGWMQWPFNRGMSAITVGGAYSGGGNPPMLFTIVANGNGALDGTTTGINIAAALYNEADSTGDPSYQYHAQTLTSQLTSVGTVTAVTFIPPYIYNKQYGSWQPDTANLATIYFLVGSAEGDVYPCSITPGTIPGNLNLIPTCGVSLG